MCGKRSMSRHFLLRARRQLPSPAAQHEHKDRTDTRYRILSIEHITGTDGLQHQTTVALSHWSAPPRPAPPLLPLMCRAISIERQKAMFSPRLVRIGSDGMECDEMRIEICTTCHVIALGVSVAAAARLCWWQRCVQYVWLGSVTVRGASAGMPAQCALKQEDTAHSRALKVRSKAQGAAANGGEEKPRAASAQRRAARNAAGREWHRK